MPNLAIIIGINIFNDKKFPMLRLAEKDALDFADTLMSENGWQKDEIKLVLGAEGTSEEEKKLAKRYKGAMVSWKKLPTIM